MPMIIVCQLNLAATDDDHHLCLRLWTSSLMIHVAWPDSFGSTVVGWRIAVGWKIAVDQTNAVDSGCSSLASFAVPAVAFAG
jgi:hypothetical protein